MHVHGGAHHDDAAGSIEDRWDAGELSCGELVVQLRLRLAAVAPGSILELVASDAGLPEDLPSWCRLTGHHLVRADPPIYLIRRRTEE